MLDKDLAKHLFSMLIDFKKHAKNHLTLPSDSPLTQTQFKTLIILKNFNKLTLKELSQELNVSSSSLSIMLNKLVDEGWVNREYHHADRRLTFFIVSEKGNHLIDEQVARKLAEMEIRIARLSKNDKENLLKSINTIGNVLKSIS